MSRARRTKRRDRRTRAGRGKVVILTLSGTIVLMTQIVGFIGELMNVLGR